MAPAGRAPAVSPGPSDDDIVRTARDLFGWDRLRAGQLEAVRCLLDGRDVLVVMPTGAGKSAVYQLAGALLDGPTVVVSPLIALQRNQLAALAASDAAGAVAVNSTQKRSDERRAWEAVRRGDAEFLFLSPEQLAKDEVVDRIASSRPSLLAVDEAHCVSQWGHDFRPDYLRIGDALRRLGRPVVVALTATASPPVRQEVAERLGMDDPVQVVRGFDRPNLRLEVQRFTTDEDKREVVVLRAAAEPKPGLVYAGTRRDTDGYARALADLGLEAAAYHAGLRAGERREVHDRFVAGKLDVVVATSAFGMGIDKADVRFVMHAHVPDSIDSYYQQAGRAGRDGAPALALLMYRPEDLGLQRFLSTQPPDEQAITRVATAVLRAGEPVRATRLHEQLELSRAKATRALNLLQQAGVVVERGRGMVVAVGDPDVPAVVTRAVEVADAQQRFLRSRLEMMRAYAETTGCRRQLLLGYFGETLDRPCGSCDTCEAGTAVPPPDGADSDGALVAGERVRHREWGPGAVMHVEPDRVTVLFESVGYRTLALAALEEGLLAVER